MQPSGRGGAAMTYEDAFQQAIAAAKDTGKC